MNWSHIVTEREALNLLTLEEAKRELDVTFPDDDAMIGDYIKSAQDYVEDYLGLFLSRATVTLFADSLPLPFHLPFGPFVSLLSMSVKGVALQPRTVAGDFAALLPTSGAVWPFLQRESGAVQVVYVAGFEAGKAPAVAKQATALIVRIFYDKPDGKEADAQWKAVHSLLGMKRVRSL